MDVDIVRNAGSGVSRRLQTRARTVGVAVPLVGLCPQALRVVRRVRAERLTYLSAAALIELAWGVQRIERNGVEGQIIEAGTALGGSALVMATAKVRTRSLVLYDTFGMIPAPSAEDGEDVHRRFTEIESGGAQGIGGDTYYGYVDDLADEVVKRFSRYDLEVRSNSVELIKGTFEDELNVESTVAFAHVDGDWYSSTLTCLEQIVPNLADNGRIVIDDYDAWSGCRKAVDFYFRNRRGFKWERRSRLHVVKA